MSSSRSPHGTYTLQSEMLNYSCVVGSTQKRASFRVLANALDSVSLVLAPMAYQYADYIITEYDATSYSSYTFSAGANAIQRFACLLGFFHFRRHMSGMLWRWFSRIQSRRILFFYDSHVQHVRSGRSLSRHCCQRFYWRVQIQSYFGRAPYSLITDFTGALAIECYLGE